MRKFTPEFIQQQAEIMVLRTPGEWVEQRYSRENITVGTHDSFDLIGRYDDWSGFHPNDASAIISAANNYLDALNEIQRLQRENESLQNQLDGKWKCAGCGEWFDGDVMSECDDEDICEKCFKEMEDGEDVG